MYTIVFLIKYQIVLFIANLLGIANKESVIVVETPKILILGNSITKHSPNLEIGWKGNWGMAATKEQNDYVHILINKITNSSVRANVKCVNIAQSFERNYWRFNPNEINSEVDYFKPDILILRLGENIPTDSTLKYDLCDALIKLSNQFSIKKGKVIITTTFWANTFIDRKLIDCANKRGWHIVDLSNLSLDEENKALGQFINKGVALHPSDKGMKIIADRIWEKLRKIL